MASNSELFDANIRIRELPRDVDNKLNMLATINGKHKWEVIRDALVEYVTKHEHELFKTLRT